MAGSRELEGRLDGELEGRCDGEREGRFDEELAVRIGGRFDRWRAIEGRI